MVILETYKLGYFTSLARLLSMLTIPPSTLNRVIAHVCAMFLPYHHVGTCCMALGIDGTYLDFIDELCGIVKTQGTQLVATFPSFDDNLDISER